MSRENLYRRWSNMKSRCYSKNNISYSEYGARGIKVCNEWINDFKAFEKWSLENGYDESLVLDRIDVNKDYSVDNCRWITYKEQGNNRRNTVYVEYNGESKPLSILAEEHGIKRSLVYSRLNNNWSIEEALGVVSRGR